MSDYDRIKQTELMLAMGTDNAERRALLDIDVSPYVETLEVFNKKTGKSTGLKYLSWAFAWKQALIADPLATYHVHCAADGLPFFQFPGGTAMVKVSVTLGGHEKTEWLYVMDHKNYPIVSPTASDVNNAIKRCLTKCIALHGIGLSLYANEDIVEQKRQDLLRALSNLFIERKLDETAKRQFLGIQEQDVTVKDYVHSLSCAELRKLLEK